MPRSRPILLAGLALLLGAPLLPAQDRRAEVWRPSLPFAFEEGVHRTDLLTVKFTEKARVRLDRNGKLFSPDGLDLEGVRELLGTRVIWRVFTRTVEELDAERRVLESRSGEDLPDLNNYYHVKTLGIEDSQALLAGLLALDQVETAYPEWAPGGIVPLGGDIPPTTPLFEGRQTFFGPAPRGFSHLKHRGIDGAQGLASQIVAQLEGAWILGHEDIPNLITKNVLGTTNFGSFGRNPSWYQHGTACVGLLNAGRNTYGVRGFVPLSQLRVSSLTNGSANMISLATKAAKAGDVFTSSFAYVISRKHAPLDYIQANFDAVKIATAKGICYTYGAGNTGQDLGNTTIYGNRYTANAPDSGGFIIGATAAGGTSRISWSNYGVKVIANGWGRGVATTGYGKIFYPNRDDRQTYTATFGGTSAAGPEVAGAIASLQAASIRQNGKPLTPAQVRAALKIHGTAVTGKIGKRPDLAKLMKAFKIADGLLVTKEAVIGKTLGLEISGTPKRLYVLLIAATRGKTSFGLNRRFLLDLATTIPLVAGSLPASGVLTSSLPVPNDATLRGKSIFAQQVTIDGVTKSLHLSNSVEIYVH